LYEVTLLGYSSRESVPQPLNEVVLVFWTQKGAFLR
jgi:hypothetical protein